MIIIPIQKKIESTLNGINFASCWINIMYVQIKKKTCPLSNQQIYPIPGPVHEDSTLVASTISTVGRTCLMSQVMSRNQRGGSGIWLQRDLWNFMIIELGGGKIYRKALYLLYLMVDTTVSGEDVPWKTIWLWILITKLRENNYPNLDKEESKENVVERHACLFLINTPHWSPQVLGNCSKPHGRRPGNPSVSYSERVFQDCIRESLKHLNLESI